MENGEGRLSREDVVEKMRELVARSVYGRVEGLTVVVLNPEGENAEDLILGGFGIYNGEPLVLKQCEDCIQKNGKRKFEGIRPLALVKLSASPGHWCPCGSMRCWCP